jgi:hypothetical protein
MNRYLIVTAILVMILILAPDGSAQTPYLQAYFDRDFTQSVDNCPWAPAGTVLDSFFVVALGFDAWLNAIEYRIDYPIETLWIADFFPSPRPLVIGNTSIGISIAYPTPLNAFSAVLVTRIWFFWMCDGCEPYHVNKLLCFKAHPSSGYLRAVRWPDLELIYATSGTAVICPLCGGAGRCDDLPVPVYRSTWGAIKAQYR